MGAGAAVPASPALHHAVVPFEKKELLAQERPREGDLEAVEAFLAPAVADAPQRVGLAGVVLRQRHVRLPAPRAEAVGRQCRQGPAQVIGVGKPQELVGVEEDDEVRAGAQQLARDAARLVGLPERRMPRVAQDEGQPLGGEAFQDRPRLVDGAVDHEHELVEEARVVPHERLDDVGLVADHPETDDARRSGHAGQPASLALTSADTLPMSARPATFGFTIAMTLPMSEGAFAPLADTASATIAATSASASCCGR